MELNFLGGVSKVGSLSMVMHDDDKTFIFDHGLLPADPPEYPMRPPLVDQAFLTHSHLDHCGMMPSLIRQNDVDINATHPTQEVSDLLLHDSLKIADIEGYPKHYEERDIDNTKAAYDLVGYDSARDIDGRELIAHEAGHIPGSSMFEMRSDEVTLFTGDINTVDSRLVNGAEPVRCDNLILEATYGGEEHPAREDTEKEFLDKVDETLQRGGQVIVPVFAVGRTQEILMILNERDYDVWYDGMGSAVNRIYMNHGGFLKDDKELRDAVKSANQVKSRSTRKEASKAEVIVTTSGMLEGGPILNYLQNIRQDPKSSVLLTGYQVEGTNGDLLLENGMIRDRGATLPVNCEVQRYDFSGHAGHSDLVDFAKRCQPENIVLMHGDKREEVMEDLSEFELYTPNRGETIEL